MADLRTAAEQPAFRPLRLANQSWGLLFKDPVHLAKLAGGWFLLMELALMIIQIISSVTPDGGVLRVVLSLFHAVITIFAIDVISVAWIRFTAVGDEAGRVLAPVDDIVIRYAIYTFITGLGIAFVALVLVYSPSVVIREMPGMSFAAVMLSLWLLIGLVIVVYVGTRLSLFWIEVVTAEAPFEFLRVLGVAWDAAYGNVVRIFVGAFIASLPFVLIAGAMHAIGAELPGQIFPLVLSVVSDAFYVAATFAILGFLALARTAIHDERASHA